MKPTLKFLKDLYLEYFNNSNTVSYMAQHHGVSVECMNAMLTEGRDIHNDYVEHLKISLNKL